MSKPSTGQPGAGTADPPKDKAPQGDDKTKQPAGGAPAADEDADDADDDAGQPNPKPKTFSQEEVNRLLAKERREFEKKQREAEERAKLSEQERLQKESADLRAQLLERDARDAVQAEAAKLGSSNPAAIYKLVKGDLEIDDKGKVTNLADVLAEAKDVYPEMFGTKKPNGPAPDAGEGTGQGGERLLTRAEIEKLTPNEIVAKRELVTKSLAALGKK